MAPYFSFFTGMLRSIVLLGTSLLTHLVGWRNRALISRRLATEGANVCKGSSASNHSTTVDMTEYMEFEACDPAKAIASISAQIAPLLRHYVTGWGSVNEFKIVRIEGAMTNFVFRCEKDCDPNKYVLVRIYGDGTDILFSREMELVNTRALADARFGPGVWGEFGNGRIEEWIVSKSLTHLDVAKPEMVKTIARKLRQLHSLPPPFADQRPLIICKLHDWLGELQSQVSLKGSASLVGAMRPLEQGGAGLDLEGLRAEVERLTRLLPAGADGTAGKRPQLAMCHNDLHQGNMLLVEESNEVEFIDFEYAGLNYIAYDIANHFCETCMDYSKDAADCMDWSLYPSEEAQSNFLAAYLHADVGSAEVEALRKEVARFSLAAHLLWGIWSLLSALNTNIDYDYVGYGTGRLRRYQRTRQAILGE